MNIFFPIISDYISALGTPERRFRTLRHIEPRLDIRGEVLFLSGGNAAIFPLCDGRVLKCWTKPRQHARDIYAYLATRDDDPILVSCRLLKDEIFIHDTLGSGVWHDLLEAQWVEGVTLETALRRAACEGGLDKLSDGFERLACRLLAREWAHGDIKPENIVVRPDGTMCLVDYDAMWIPALAGETTEELGTPQYQHPARDEAFFCKSIDDFPVALIAVSLRALARDPAFYRYKYGDNTLFWPTTDEAYDDVLKLFAERGEWSSLRLAMALRTPVPQIEGLWAMLAARCDEIAVEVFERPPVFSGGVASVCVLGRWKIIDTTGAIVASLECYDEVKPFSHGFAATRKEGLWGYVCADGRELVGPRFEMAESMHEGCAVVKEVGRYGFLGADGNMALAAVYDYATGFRGGRATVMTDGGLYEIDHAGQVLAKVI